MKELNEQDRERIKQEACNQIPHGYQYWSPFIRGAEYATIYERDRVELLEGTIRTMIKEHSKNTDRLVGEIEQLEAERSELIRRIKSILKASTVHDKISIIEELEQLLNSLKTK